MYWLLPVVLAMPTVTSTRIGEVDMSAATNEVRSGTTVYTPVTGDPLKENDSALPE